jgi:hypothetical protein
MRIIPGSSLSKVSGMRCITGEVLIMAEISDTIKDITSNYVNDVFYLPIFREKTYPQSIETIADNHPVYVNGTKLVNGYQIIDDRHKDISRIDEFNKIRFSKEYIQYLTDARICSYYFHGEKGKPINYGTSLPGKPSYKGITCDNDIHDPDHYEIKHKLTIDKDYSVSLNNRLIASAPLKKTKAFKERFCKAIIWSLMNDPECLKDKLKEISGIIADEKPIVLETIQEKKYCAKLPVFPIGFLPHLNLTITEERCTA